MIAGVLVGLMLLTAAIEDLRGMRIHAGLLIVFGAAAACARAAQGPFPEMPIRIAAGALVGTGLWLIAVITREAIGKGDALAVLFTGMGTGAPETLLVLTIALAGAALAGAVLLIMRRADKKSRIPFIPFIAGAYLLVHLFSWWGS